MIGKKINQLATELAPVSTDLTIIGDPISGVSKKITLAQLGAIFSGAVSFYTNLAGFPATGDINVIYCAKDTQKLYLWSGSAYVEVFPSQALLDTYQLRSEKGNANGYASLDSQGKVPISQLPSSIMEYKGTWSAATNTPTLANGTGDTGDVYICNVAGTVNFGAGAITFAVGDYVIYSGTIWQRSSGAVGTVTSVAASITGDSVTISGSPVTTSGTLAFAFAGTGAQYIKGDGTLATFPNTIDQAKNLITEVYNSTGATLTKGTIVYINGGQGNLPTVTKALASGDSTSAQTYGIVQADITNNNNGFVVVAGRLADIDTSAFSVGTQLYLSSTTAGAYTSTKQYAPAHLVYVGIIVRSHPTQGIIEVKIQNGYELDELHDVAAQSPDNNDILQYKTSTGLWTKVAGTTSNIAEGSNLYYTDARSRAALSFTAGSGAYNSTTGVITIPTNTNQLTNGANYITLASLSAGAGISYNNTTGVIASTITQYTDALARAAISLTTTGTSGAATYNSTTGVLNIPQYADQFVGTVTSVGLSSSTSGVTIGSTPITTSGTITLAIATASGSQQGLLSSTDWTTFNNKQNALTNPVTGTGTTNYLTKFTGTSTIGNSIVFDDGTNVGIGTATPSRKLDVSGSGRFTGDLTIANSSRLFLNGSTGQDWALRTNSSTANFEIVDWGSTVARIIMTPSGNLGLGVTPSAWSTYPALQISNASLWGAINNAYVGANYYFDGSTRRYIANGNATEFAQVNGEHRFYTSASGTAGNAISFTQAMTLNASGNLSIGNTNDSFKLDVTGTGRFTSLVTISSDSGGSALRLIGRAAADASAIRFFANNNSTQNARIESNSSEFEINSISSLPIIFRTADTTRLTIASTGAATFSSSVTATQFIVGSPSTSSDVSIRYRTDTGDFSTINDRGSHAFGIYDHQVSSYRMYINTSGNVGIGTTSPSYRLVVNSGTDGISAGISGSTYGIRFDNGGTFSSGMSTIHGVDTTLTGSYQPIMINGSDVRFGTSATERMRITSGGNVGIGTTSSIDSKFTVSSATKGIGLNEANVQIQSNESLAANIGGSLGFGATSDYGIVTLAKVGGYRENSTGTSVSSYLAFETRSGGNANTERMRITSGGNLLVGDTTNSGDRLRVVGTDYNNAAYLLGGSTTGASYGLQIRAGSNSSDYSLLVQSRAGSDYLKIAGTGAATFSGDVKVKTLEITNVGTYGSSAGISTYMAITVNGQNYVIPLHGTP